MTQEQEAHELAPTEVRRRTATLLFSIMVIAINGVIYELLIGGYSSYLLGDSITQFSLTIGLFMSSMGIGSWLTQFVDRDLEKRFIEIEIALAVVGGPTVLLLAMAHLHTRVYTWVMFAMIIAIGALIGFEIPMVTRIVNRYGSLKQSLANVLSFDYIGALFGSLVFPLLLLPELGFVRTSFLIGLVSLVVGMVNLRVFGEEIGRSARFLWGVCLLTVILLTVGMWQSTGWIERAREKKTGQKLVFLHHSPYQTLRFVQETNRQGQLVHRLFINGEHQFSTDSERRYHEMLVHPVMSAARNHRRVLVLGGGDGLVLRELWKYPGIKSVTLVDLDPAMVKWARRSPLLRKLHGDAFRDRRLKVLHKDAFLFVQKQQPCFDAVVMDLPTPTNIALSKLYTSTFFRYLRKRLCAGGAAVTEAAVLDPLENRPFWCIERTARSAGWKTSPYSQASMAYLLMTKESLRPARLALRTAPMKYLTTLAMRQAFVLPDDVKQQTPAPINSLDSHSLLRLVLALR